MPCVLRVNKLSRSKLLVSNTDVLCSQKTIFECNFSLLNCSTIPLQDCSSVICSIASKQSHTPDRCWDTSHCGFLCCREQKKGPSRKRLRPTGAGAQTAIQASSATQASAITVPEAAVSSAAQPQVGHRPRGLTPSP